MIEALRDGARKIHQAGRSGGKLGTRAAAKDLGYPSMISSLYRLVTAAKAQSGFAAQDAFVAAYQFPACAADALSLRRKFNATEFDFVAEVVKYATASGFP